MLNGIFASSNQTNHQTRFHAVGGRTFAGIQNPQTTGCSRTEINQTTAAADPVSYTHLDVYKRQAVIGVNPVTDDVENLSRVLDTIYGVIDKFNIRCG